MTSHSPLPLATSKQDEFLVRSCSFVDSPLGRKPLVAKDQENLCRGWDISNFPSLSPSVWNLSESPRRPCKSSFSQFLAQQDLKKRKNKFLPSKSKGKHLHADPTDVIVPVLALQKRATDSWTDATGETKKRTSTVWPLSDRQRSDGLKGYWGFRMTYSRFATKAYMAYFLPDSNRAYSPDPCILVSIKATFLSLIPSFLPNRTPYSLPSPSSPTVDSIAVDSILPSNQPSSSNCGKKK